MCSVAATATGSTGSVQLRLCSFVSSAPRGLWNACMLWCKQGPPLGLISTHAHKTRKPRAARKKPGARVTPRGAFLKKGRVK